MPRKTFIITTNFGKRMSYHFKAQTLEWQFIGKALERDLKYCYDIKPSTIRESGVIIVPLFEFLERDMKYLPTGLDYLKRIRREKKGAFSTIFLVQSESEIPKYFKPTGEMALHAEEIIKNPQFGDIGKAIFLAELRYDSDTKSFKNIIDLSCANSVMIIAELVKNPQSLPPHLVDNYYSTFVEFYDSFGPIDVRGSLELDLCKFLTEVCRSSEDHCIEKLNESCEELESINFYAVNNVPFLKLANRIYNCLNNIEEKGKGGHNVSLELFRAPVPFPLQELIDAKEEIIDGLKGENDNNGLNLLLIDNKIDKVIKSDDGYIFEKGELISVLFSEEWGMPAFKLEMLGSRENGIEPLVFKKETPLKLPENLEAYRDIQKREAFHCDEFIEQKDNDLGNNDYARRVYKKIRDTRLVLLDFFLNEENTFLAFDFIRHIARMKRDNGDYFTTWYFITSAVHDSVVKYSQSGLLAEYYESAVVNAGDDPTNKKRQIIFIYKLLTFIQARIKSFDGLGMSIKKCKLLNCAKYYDNKCNQKEAKECLSSHQSLFRKYVGEFDEIIKIFPGKEPEEKQFRETVELLNSTINQFLWLPEADWPMIQRQIEFVNSKLTGISGSKNMEFSCSHIKCEIEKRSDIY